MKCEEREVICRDGRAALLRSAHPDDAAEMVRFLLDVCGETEFLLAYPEERQSLTDEGERTFLTRLTADDNELMLTAWVDGQLAGVANINFSTRLKMRHRANVAISIRRAYWRLGLGTAMLTELVDVAKARPEVRQVELEFIEGNSRAQALVREGRLPRRRRPPGRFCAERRRDEKCVFDAIENKVNCYENIRF